MLDFAEAQARLLALATPLGAERAALSDAVGRVLAEDVEAAGDVPAFDASIMDGYAVRSADLAESLALPVAGESRAGAPSPPLAAGTAFRIFTGAPMPDGADAVVMQEEVRREGDVAIFAKAPKAGAFVRRRGDDLRAGDTVLARGTRLGPPHLALLASVDRPTVGIARAPLVALLATGDELREPGSAPRPGTIPESNGLALAAMMRGVGARVRVLPKVPDEAEATRAAVLAGLDGADVLVTVGGVSVGDHDLVRPALEAAGVVLDFWRVAIKPGKPLAVGTRGRTLALGLPGNPASAMVTCALFVLPLLRAMQGDRHPFPTPVRARLAKTVERAPGRLEFARARLLWDERGALVEPLTHQASGAAWNVAMADALAVLPKDEARVEEGTLVDVYPFGGLGL
jgi:molybdopterin molybdotransferase